MTSLVAWHGANRWAGPPEVRVQSEATSEHGPGIYLATGYNTARRYGRSVMLFSLRPDLGWLENAAMPLVDAVDAASSLFGRAAGARMSKSLSEYAARVSPRLGGGAVDTSVLVNLAVNEHVAHGARGVALARFLAGRGIGASLVHQSGEDWIVVFDPAVVVGVRKAADADYRALGFDLPRIAEQYKRMAGA